MKSYRWIVPFVLILFVATCGRKTLPRPYAAQSNSLPIVSSIKTTYRGDDLHVRWESPLAKGVKKSSKGKIFPDHISAFQLNFMRPGLDCYSCESDLLGTIKVDVSSNEIVFRDFIDDIPLVDLSFSREGDSYLLVIPSQFMQNPIFKDHHFLMITYVVHQGDSSAPSRRLIPKRPVSIPPPNVAARKLIIVDPAPRDWELSSNFWKTDGRSNQSERKSQESKVPSHFFLPLRPMETKQPTNHAAIPTAAVDHPTANPCKPPMLEYFLLLEWSPRQETIYHVILEDGKTEENIRYFGVNLYRVERKGHKPSDPMSVGNSQEKLINPRPLLKGRFSLTNFQDLLYARNVDQYGNESRRVLVFDGTYR